jgi:hypothetical protein
MALVDLDDFALDTDLTRMGWIPSSVGCFSVQAAAGRFGVPAMRCSGDNHRYKPIFAGGTYTEIYLNFALNMSTFGIGNGFHIELQDVGGQFTQAGISVIAGEVQARKGARAGTGTGTLLATSSVVLAEATQYQFEVYVKLHGSTGIVTIKKDGVQILNATNLNTLTGGTNCNAILVYGGGGVFDLSHFLVMDTSGSHLNGFIGDQRMKTNAPTGNSAVVQMTPSTGTNWQCVNTAPPTDVANVQGASGKKDRYTFGAVGLTTTAVHAVVGRYRAQKTDAGDLTMEPVIKADGTEAIAASQVLAVGYQNFLNPWYVDPSTLAAWAADLVNVNAAEIGQQAT